MPSRFRPSIEDALISIGAIWLSAALFGIFCALMGASPGAVFQSLYKAGFADWYSWQNSLIRAAPLMLCGLCTVIPARAGVITIGNEGAFVIGGLAAIAAGLACQTAPPVLALICMGIAGAAGGGLWISLAAGLQHGRGVNAVISSLLLNYIGISIMLQLVEGPMRDPSSLNYPATFALQDTHRLGVIPGTRIHLGLIFGIVACLGVWLLFEYSVWGMKVKVAGGNPKTALLVGLPLGRLILTAGFLGGCCAGLAGMVEVAAVHGRASQAISAGYGYAGILVAFLARQSPLRVLIISILLGGLLASGGILQRAHDLPDATITVFEGIIFLVILASETLYGRYRLFRQEESTC